MKKRIFPLGAKLFLGFFALIALFLTLITVTVSNTYAEILKEKEVAYNLLATNTIKREFDSAISLIQNTTASLTRNEGVQRTLRQLETGETPLPEEVSATTTLLDNALIMRPFLENIHIIGAGGDVLSTSTAYKQQLRDDYADYIEKAMRGEGTEFWKGAHPKPLSYIVPIFQPNPRRVAGLLVLDINHDFIYETFTSSAISANERVMMVDSGGGIIFNFPYNISYVPFLEQNPEILQYDQYRKEAKVYGQDCVIVSESIKIADWKIIRLISLSTVTEDTVRLGRILRNILIISVVAGLLLSLWLSRFFTKPIRKLTEACQRAELGDMSARVDVRSHDELGNLGKTFNMMIAQIGSSVEKELRDRERKAELHFQVLQAQVNPHFLYNTLDSIRWMAVMQSANNIAEMSAALINLLKYNLAAPDTKTTLHDELESVRHYIQIQKFRYSDNFDFSSVMDPDTAGCTVPRFVLQPLVENSIIHGFDDVEKSYQIRISSFLSEGRLHIKVIDNGSGMSPERIEAVNAGLQRNHRYSFIGVTNIRERIRFYYGDGYGLSYSSEPNVGTIAEVILPMLREEPAPAEEPAAVAAGKGQGA